MNKKLNVYLKEFPSHHLPSGLPNIFLVSTDIGLAGLFIGKSKLTVIEIINNKYTNCEIVEPREVEFPAFSLIIENLKNYFNHRAFSFGFPVDLEGTEFQKAVWSGIRKIPLGKTVSYKELAIQIGRPKAVRPLGSACGRNPLPIIIPCHRVIARDGSIGGFSLGLDLKRMLASIEGVEL